MSESGGLVPQLRIFGCFAYFYAVGCIFFFPCTVLRTLGWSTDDYVDIDGQCISKIRDEAGLANAIWRDKESMRSVPTN